MNDVCVVSVFTIKGGNPTELNTLATVQQTISKLITMAGFTSLGAIDHSFEPQGISLVALLEESHIAVHTWPEKGSAYIVITTCSSASDGFAGAASQYLTDVFGGTVNHQELA